MQTPSETSDYAKTYTKDIKIVYGWVVNWGEVSYLGVREPDVTVDLFFSSRERFEELLGWSKENMAKEILIPVNVPASFDDIDYIPENY